MDYFVKPRIVLHLIGLVLLAIAGPAPADPSTQFPHRGAFPNVVTISAERLAASLDDHLIVDVRSEFEFDIVHIQGAHNASRGDYRDCLSMEPAHLSSRASAAVQSDYRNNGGKYTHQEKRPRSHRGCQPAVKRS